MDYELAKQLKDAGFPNRCPLMVPKTQEELELMPEMMQSWPTLSELIAACGDKLGGLSRLPGGEYSTEVLWIAYPAYGGDVYKEARERNTSPEEAVGRLWLSLNKK